MSLYKLGAAGPAMIVRHHAPMVGAATNPEKLEKWKVGLGIGATLLLCYGIYRMSQPKPKRHNPMAGMADIEESYRARGINPRTAFG